MTGSYRPARHKAHHFHLVGEHAELYSPVDSVLSILYLKVSANLKDKWKGRHQQYLNISEAKRWVKPIQSLFLWVKKFQSPPVAEQTSSAQAGVQTCLFARQWVVAEKGWQLGATKRRINASDLHVFWCEVCSLVVVAQVAIAAGGGKQFEETGCSLAMTYLLSKGPLVTCYHMSTLSLVGWFFGESHEIISEFHFELPL